MPRMPRLTIRRLMLVVAVAGICMGVPREIRTRQRHFEFLSRRHMAVQELWLDRAGMRFYPCFEGESVASKERMLNMIERSYKERGPEKYRAFTLSKFHGSL